MPHGGWRSKEKKLDSQPQVQDTGQELEGIDVQAIGGRGEWFVHHVLDGIHGETEGHQDGAHKAPFEIEVSVGAPPPDPHI